MMRMIRGAAANKTAIATADISQNSTTPRQIIECSIRLPRHASEWRPPAYVERMTPSVFIAVRISADASSRRRRRLADMPLVNRDFERLRKCLEIMHARTPHRPLPLAL